MQDLLDEALPLLAQNIIEKKELAKFDFFQQEALTPFHTSLLIFECPLKEKTRWVDLSIRVDPSSERFTQLLECLNTAFSQLPTKETWQRCLRLISKPLIKSGWFGIELDIGSGGNKPAAPNLFVCTREFQGKEFCRFARELASELEGKTLSCLHSANLDRHVEVCASMGDPIFACGMMLGRQGNKIRIHSALNLLSGLSPLKERLQKMGYLESTDELMRLLEKFPHSTLDDIGLSLDIGEEIGLKVGIERFGNPAKLTQEEWGPLFAILIREGLAEEEIVEGCMNWVGGTLMRGDQDQSSLLGRRIGHFKLVSQPDQPLQAKIYLNIVHKLLTHL